MDGLVAVLAGLAVVYFALWLFILLPARMAEARGRSAFGWVLVSLVFSPLLAILLMLLLGNAPDRRA